MSRVAAASVVALLALLAARPAVGAEAQTESVSWLGLGDSYSSGEGLVDVGGSHHLDKKCQRATGEGNRQSAAWAPAAVASLNKTRPAKITLDFVPCTGAITDDILTFSHERHDPQLLQGLERMGLKLNSGQRHALYGMAKWDVVSFSMGGNNTRFSDVIMDCIGVNDAGDKLARAVPGKWGDSHYVGCDVTQDELIGRATDLTAEATRQGHDHIPCDQVGAPQPVENGLASEEHWDADVGSGNNGRLSIPELYDIIGRCVVKPGGLVVVVGYPQLIETPELWHEDEGERCHRIRRDDVPRLRAAAEELNKRLRAAADAASGRFRGTQFLFVDPGPVFEGEWYEAGPLAQPVPDSARHGLCAPGGAWLHGLTAGTGGTGLIRPLWSFHPKQVGHDSIARAVVTQLPTGSLKAGARTPATMFESATTLVIDTSSSMEEPSGDGLGTKLDAAKSAAAKVAKLIEGQASAPAAGQQAIGVVEFSSSAFTASTLTSDLGTARSAVAALASRDGTNIGAGLSTAIDQLRGAHGSKAIVLLSDGQTNEGPTADEILNGVVPQAVSADIKVFTVGFGEPGTIDEGLLRGIASATGGVYSFATSPTSLSHAFFEARADTLGDVQLSSLGAIAQDEIATVGPFTIDRGLGELEIALTWPGSDVDVILRDPKGRTVDENYKGAQIIRDNPEVVTVSEPIGGEWQLALKGVDIPGPTEEYAVVASTRGLAPPRPQGGNVLIVMLALLGVAAGTGTPVMLMSRRRGRMTCTRCRATLVSGARVCDQCGAAVTPFLTLRVLGGPEDGRVLWVSAGEIIGRLGAHHELLDDTVSRQHVQVDWEQDSWVVVDLGSTSGTVRNAEHVLQARLQHGDVLVLGETMLLVEDPAGAPMADQAAGA